MSHGRVWVLGPGGPQLVCVGGPWNGWLIDGRIGVPPVGIRDTRGAGSSGGTAGGAGRRVGWLDRFLEET